MVEGFLEKMCGEKVVGDVLVSLAMDALFSLRNKASVEAVEALEVLSGFMRELNKRQVSNWENSVSNCVRLKIILYFN